MACIDIIEVPVEIQNAKEQRCVAAHLRVLAEKAIDEVEDSGRIGANRHTGKSALKHCGDKCCAESLAGNICDQKGGAVIGDRENVEVVAADGETGRINPGDREMRKVSQPDMKKRLLYIARDTQFLIQTLPMALLFDEARVV